MVVWNIDILRCGSCLCTLSVSSFTWNLFRSCGSFKAKHWAPSNDFKVLVSNHFNWACYYPSNLKIIGGWLCGWNWASLSKPHIDHDNDPCTRNNAIYLSMYVSMYHLPRVCCTLVPEIRVHPEMLLVFRYIDVLTCVIYNCMHSTEQQLNSKTTGATCCLPWTLSTKTGRWMRRHMV